MGEKRLPSWSITAWAPTHEDVTSLVETLDAHGWVGQEEGAWFQVWHELH